MQSLGHCPPARGAPGEAVQHNDGLTVERPFIEDVKSQPDVSQRTDAPPPRESRSDAVTAFQSPAQRGRRGTQYWTTTKATRSDKRVTMKAVTEPHPSHARKRRRARAVEIDMLSTIRLTALSGFIRTWRSTL